MKFLFATDTHTSGKGPSSRKDSYPMAVKRKLTELALVAKKDPNIIAVIHGGDLFDKPVVSEQLKGEVAEIIRSSGKPWYVVPGNHDLFGYNINTLPQTSLGLLAKTGVIQILDRAAGPAVFTDLTGVTVSFEGQEYHREIDKRDVGLDYWVSGNAQFKVLIPHSMLLDRPYYPDVPHTLVSDLNNRTAANLILVGHYHDGFDIQTIVNSEGRLTEIFNPGSMLRDECSKGNMVRKPQYIVLEHNSFTNTIEMTVKEFKSAESGKKIFDRSQMEDKRRKDFYLQSFEQKLGDSALSAVDVYSVLTDIVQRSVVSMETHTEAVRRLTNAEFQVDDITKQMIGFVETPDNIWITRIIMKGFQSHEDSTIDFGPGLNAIIGPSDSGKSAIIRALRFVLYNVPRGTDFIRQGNQASDFVSVRVEFSNQTALERSRTRESAGSYIIESNGSRQTLQGFSNNVPVDVANIHQMPQLQLTKDLESSLNIGFQLDPPFLIGESPSNRATIIGQLTGVNLVDAALKEINKDVLTGTRDMKLYSEQMDQITQKLKGFVDLPYLKQDITTMNGLIERLDESIKLKDELISLKDDEDAYYTAGNVLFDEALALSKIEMLVPKLDKLEILERNRVELLQLRNDYDKLLIEEVQLNTEDIACKKLEYISMVSQGLDRLYKQFREYEDLNDEYETLQYEIKANLYEYHKVSQLIASPLRLDFLAEKIQLKKELEDMSSQFNTLQEEANTLTQGIEYSEIEETYYTKEYHTILDEIGTCPTCNQLIPKGV
jgi:DNA repair exonuclease SbcCD nuclease subunit